jgi:hypothetical protein
MPETPSLEYECIIRIILERIRAVCYETSVDGSIDGVAFTARPRQSEHVYVSKAPVRHAYDGRGVSSGAGWAGPQ